MLLLILSIIDIAAGISLIFPNLLGFYLGVVILLKGLSSMLGLATRDIGVVIMGIIDLATGIILLLSFSVPWFWLLVVLKGTYCLILGLGS